MATNRVGLPKYIAAGDMSASITGPWINFEGLDNVSFHAVWTGSPVGTFVVEVSNDDKTTDSQTQKPSGTLGPSALTLPSSMTVTAAVPSGSSGNFYFDFNQLSARWIRFSYAKTSGTGSLSVGANAKGF